MTTIKAITNVIHMAWPNAQGPVTIPRLDALEATSLTDNVDLTQPVLQATGEVIITMHRVVDGIYEWMVGMDWDAHTIVYARRELDTARATS